MTLFWYWHHHSQVSRRNVRSTTFYPPSYLSLAPILRSAPFRILYIPCDDVHTAVAVAAFRSELAPHQSCPLRCLPVVRASWPTPTHIRKGISIRQEGLSEKNDITAWKPNNAGFPLRNLILSLSVYQRTCTLLSYRLFLVILD